MSIEELKELQNGIIKKNKRLNRITIIVAAIIFILFLVNFFIIPYMNGGVDSFSLMPSVAFFFMVLIILLIVHLVSKAFLIGNDTEKFKKEFKNIFVVSALQKTFSNLEYVPEKGFDESYMDQIGMLDTGDRYHSEDYVSGDYKKIHFEQADIHVMEEEEEKDSDGNTRTEWVTIFLGRWMIFDFNKSFKSDLRVSHSFYCTSWPGKEHHQIDLEDEEFNKNFSVVAENEHDAFYILTPHLMQKMKEITEKIHDGIMFCFVDNKLHIAINSNEDTFEQNPLIPINEQEIEKKLTEEIKVIIDFVEELDLDNDLFMRKENQ